MRVSLLLEDPIVHRQHIREQLQLTCPICLSIYDEARKCPMMVCSKQHSMCQQCLHQFTRQDAPICPECRQLLVLAAIGKNRIVLQLLAFTQAVEGKVVRDKRDIILLKTQNFRLSEQLRLEALKMKDYIQMVQKMEADQKVQSALLEQLLSHQEENKGENKSIVEQVEQREGKRDHFAKDRLTLDSRRCFNPEDRRRQEKETIRPKPKVCKLMGGKNRTSWKERSCSYGVKDSIQEYLQQKSKQKQGNWAFSTFQELDCVSQKINFPSKSYQASFEQLNQQMETELSLNSYMPNHLPLATFVQFKWPLLMRLDLSHNNLGNQGLHILTSIPLINLTNLRMENNHISQVVWTPVNIARVKHLNLSNNQISMIPSNIKELPLLQSLSLANNTIERLDVQCFQLQHLQQVILRPELGQM